MDVLDQVIAQAADGFDRTWHRNAVGEALDKADIKWK
jgi:hypothetical protein